MTEAETVSSVSSMLVDARESKGLSQKEVAEELFLTTTFIRYIDNGEFHKIPKPAFIKGYLRSYARVVALDGDEVVARFEEEQQVTPEAPEIRGVTEEPVGSGSITGPVLQTGLIGLIAIVFVGCIVWWIAADRAEEAPSVVVSTPDVVEPAYEPEPSPVIDTISMETSVEGPMEGSIEGSIATEEGIGEVESLPMDVEESPVMETEGSGEETMAAMEPADLLTADVDPTVRVERVQDGDTSYITVYANGEDSMEFSFSGECWVEIDDGNGEQIYGDLNRAGDVMTVMGQGPFDVLLGKAPAVRMMMNGNEVDLQPFTTTEETARVRTARL